LRHALVDNIETDFGQAMNIRLSRTKIAPFDRIVEQAENAIAVVLIVLGSVDTTLRCDTVGPARRILEAKALNVISEFTQGRGCGGACEAAADNDDIKFGRSFGATNFDSPRCFSHFFSNGPEGTFESSIVAIGLPDDSEKDCEGHRNVSGENQPGQSLTTNRNKVR
jgi:hypothetical protein